MKYKKRTQQENFKLKKQAKYLLLVNGYSQIQVSKKLGVSKNSISRWSKDGEWRKTENETIRKHGGAKAFIEKFFIHLLNNEVDILPKIKNQWDIFLKKNEVEF